MPRILLGLYAARFNGRLDLSRQRTQKAFTLQDGAPVGSESTLPAELLASVLQDTGLLDPSDRKAIDAYVKENQCPEGVALLSLQLVEPKQLFEGLREQLRRRMIECFGWTSGDYTLTGTEERNEDVQRFRVDPYGLVQDGLQTHWDLERMLGDLGPGLNRFAMGGTGLGKVTRRLTLDASVERMIAGLNGRQTLGTVIGAALSSPAALAAFWVLDAAGVLEYTDSARESANDEGPTEIEIQITRPESGSVPTGAKQQARAKAGGTPKSGTGPESEKMRAEVLERLERLDSLDFYELLGVDPKAEHGVIRKAYFLAAKRYHPDAIARMGLQDIRSQAGEVFSKIAEANDVLSDMERRAAYDRSLETGVSDIDVTVIAQAETFYRKGEILINMGDFRGALEYMQNAVELYPDEAVYQSDLAWCYYKKSPPEPEPALVHIREALERDPSNAVAQFRLSLIERNA